MQRVISTPGDVGKHKPIKVSPTAPLSITAAKNFGAGGRRGTISMVPVGGDENAAALWQALQAQVADLTDPADFESTTLFCMGRHLPFAPANCGPEPRLIITQMPGQVPANAIGVHLADYQSLDQLERHITVTEGRRLLVVGGVLEHLTDPRPLLRLLRRLLKRHPDSLLVVGTLDRSSILPSDVNYLRLWTGKELRRFLASSGFQVISSRNIGGSQVVCELRCSVTYYDAFLQANRLPSTSSRMVLIARDHADGACSNIEQSLQEWTRLVTPRPLVLALGEPFAPPDKDWLRAEDLAEWDNAWHAPEGALEAVKHLLFLYDEVRLLDYHDSGGVFFRIAQAKRAGLLPADLTCQVTCHGSHFHVERVRKEWQGPDSHLTHLWEKLALELADVVRCPTDYIRSLYFEQLNLQPLGKVRVLGLPYDYSPRTVPAPSAIDTVIFCGPQEQATGWHVFCDAIEALLRSHQSRILRIVLLGPALDDRKTAAPPGIAVETYDMAKTREVLRGLASSALVVLPLSYSSYPYPILTALDSGCQLLVVTGSGAEELLPPTYRKQLSCTLPQLADALRESLALSIDARHELLSGLAEAVRQRQQAVNAATADFPAAQPVPDLQPLLSSPSPITVVVPVYNRPFGEIEDLIVGINNQVLPPSEVIFVDDASTEDFATRHGERIKELLAVPARFIRHPRNQGLAGARNTGLLATETELIAVHDSDNIADHDFLYRGCLTLRANPHLDAVTFLLETFVDGQDWLCFEPRRTRYYPIGDGLVASLTHINWLGDAMGVYRVSSLRAIGGWDESDNAMWEDLALFLKMLSTSQRIMNVPALDVLYRVRADSMLRTASEYDARQRLVRAVGSLNTFEALCLMRLVLADMLRQPDQLNAKGHLVHAVRQYLAHKPRLYKTARWILRRVQRTWKMWHR